MDDRVVKEHRVCEWRGTTEPAVEDEEAGALAEDACSEACLIFTICEEAGWRALYTSEGPSIETDYSLRVRGYNKQ